MLNISNIEPYIDSTNLNNIATNKDIELLVNQALRFGFVAVCLPQYYLSFAKELIFGSCLKLCTVVGFPFGYNNTYSKYAETESSIKLGACEIDMVANITALKNCQYNYIEKEIKSLSELCHCEKAILKVIIETSLLTKKEKIEMCRIISDSGADFIKTSTGFSIGGATFEDVMLLKENVSSNVQVKASGGIKNLKFALKLIEAGASRIGTSSAAYIYNEFKELKEQENLNNS